MDNQVELKLTFLEEYASAKLLFEKDMLKSAVILLSKALFALCDYIPKVINFRTDLITFVYTKVQINVRIFRTLGIFSS